MNDPFSVVLRRNKLPMSLIQDQHTRPAEQRARIAQTEPFKDTFGPRAQRKKPKIDSASFADLAASVQSDQQQTLPGPSSAASVPVVATAVEVSTEEEKEVSGETRSMEVEMDVENLKSAPREAIYGKGTSKRIWGELYKVIDSSDVIIHVIDARDPLGTICQNVVDVIKKERGHKHLVFLLNKVDLVPTWVTVRSQRCFLVVRHHLTQ